MKRRRLRFALSVCVLAFAFAGGPVRAEDEVQSVAQNMPGFKAQMQYQDLGNGESVNADNGGLTVTHRSAIGLAGNMGSEVRPVRVYNSKLASDGYDDVNCSHFYDRPYGPLGFGWKISFGRILMRNYRRDFGTPGGPMGGYQCLDFFDYYYEDESGAQHHLFPMGGHTYDPSTHSPTPVWYVTNDGSYIRAKYQPSLAQWVLYFPDGSVRRAGDPETHGFVEPVLEYTPSTLYIPGIPTIVNPFSNGWYVTLIRDRAGNETRIGYVPFDATGQAGTPLGGSIDRITDPFGRQIRFHYGLADTGVVDAAFLLERIGQFPSSQSGETDLLRFETFTYGTVWTQDTFTGKSPELRKAVENLLPRANSNGEIQLGAWESADIFSSLRIAAAQGDGSSHTSETRKGRMPELMQAEGAKDTALNWNEAYLNRWDDHFWSSLSVHIALIFPITSAKAIQESFFELCMLGWHYWDIAEGAKESYEYLETNHE